MEVSEPSGRTGEACESSDRVRPHVCSPASAGGAVPSVTDATSVQTPSRSLRAADPSASPSSIRTILSQNTTNQNSSAAYASLLATFGPSSRSVKAVNLTKIHDAPHATVSAAIKTGGLNDRKAKYIQGVLSSVRDRNLRYLTDPTFYDVVPGVKEEEGEELKPDVKPLVKPEPKEIDFSALSPADEEALYSLDYIHHMKDEDAIAELVSFDGVGPKSQS